MNVSEVKCCSSGILLATISSLLFTTCSLIAKYLKLNPIEASLISFLGIILFSLPLTRYNQLLPPKGYRFLFVARSIIGTVFLISSFRSVQLISLGDASVLFSTAPMFTFLLGSIFLKEPFTVHSAFMLFIIMCGIVLVTQPVILTNTVNNNSSEYIFGISCALLASLSEAVNNIILRKLKKLHFSTIMFNHGVLSFLLTLILIIFMEKLKIDLENYVFMLILTVGTVLEQLLVILALRLENAGHIALVQASDIIYGYVFQIIFFGEMIEFIPMIGATIVTSVIIHMARYGHQNINQEITV